MNARVLVTSLLAACLTCGIAQAQLGAATPRPTDTPQVDVLQKPGGMKVFRFRKGLLIRGQAPPHAVIHLSRARFDYTPPAPQQHLAAHIAGHLRRSPF